MYNPHHYLFFAWYLYENIVLNLLAMGWRCAYISLAKYDNTVGVSAYVQNKTVAGLSVLECSVMMPHEKYIQCCVALITIG